MKERDYRANPRKYVPEYEHNDNLEPAVIHPDITYATRHYDGTGKSFEECMELRRQARAEGREYWQSDWDLQLAQTAEERTKCAASKGWRFPKVGERRKG